MIVLHSLMIVSLHAEDVINVKEWEEELQKALCIIGDLTKDLLNWKIKYENLEKKKNWAQLFKSQ